MVLFSLESKKPALIPLFMYCAEIVDVVVTTADMIRKRFIKFIVVRNLLLNDIVYTLPFCIKDVSVRKIIFMSREKL